MSHVLKPIGDRLIVELIEQEALASGILLPDTIEVQRPNEGVVIAVGIGRTENGVRIPLEVNTGDRVIISDYAGTDLRLESRTFSILREHDVLAVIGKNYPFRKLHTYVAEEEPDPRPTPEYMAQLGFNVHPDFKAQEKANLLQKLVRCGRCSSRVIPRETGIFYCSACGKGNRVTIENGDVRIDPYPSPNQKVDYGGQLGVAKETDEHLPCSRCSEEVIPKKPGAHDCKLCGCEHQVEQVGDECIVVMARPADSEPKVSIEYREDGEELLPCAACLNQTLIKEAGPQKCRTCGHTHSIEQLGTNFLVYPYPIFGKSKSHE